MFSFISKAFYFLIGWFDKLSDEKKKEIIDFILNQFKSIFTGYYRRYQEKNHQDKDSSSKQGGVA